jgi:hypothetical protein
MSKDNLMDYIGPAAETSPVKRLSHDDLLAILVRLHFPGYKFKLGNFIDRMVSVVYFLQAEFHAPCADTGKLTLQKSRKWYLSEHMTESEVVQTAFKCVLTAIEHEAREQFKYKGQAIFGPHFNVNDLVELAASGRKDVRS